jgi:hypothetical protein
MDAGRTPPTGDVIEAVMTTKQTVIAAVAVCVLAGVSVLVNPASAQPVASMSPSRFTVIVPHAGRSFEPRFIGAPDEITRHEPRRRWTRSRRAR